MAEAPKYPRHVLVVEDRAEVRAVVVRLLQAEGYCVHEATDGEAALEVIRQGLVELALVDVLLPRLNGWEVLKEVRQDPAHKTLPVLLFTGLPTLEGEERARVLGANGYLLKPFPMSDLLQIIRLVLENRAQP